MLATLGRRGGQTGGYFCLEKFSHYVIRNRWIALDVKKLLNTVNKNFTNEPGGGADNS